MPTVRAADARAFGDLCEATEGFAAVWRREGWPMREIARWADGDVLTLLVLAKWLRRDATRLIDRARCRLRRPLYYAREVDAVPELAVVRARAVWLEVTAGVRGSATALMERLDALTDPERVEDTNMLLLRQ